jgi:hypothetical protein
LQQAALDRESCVLEIERRDEGAHLRRIEQLGIHAVQPHRIAAPGGGVALGVGVEQVQHAALADHGVVVDVLLQPLPQFQRPFVKGRVGRQQIVGTDDRGVAPDIARADPAFLDDGDVGQAVLAGEVIGCRKPVPPAADDHDVIEGLRVGLPPDRLPALLPGHGLREQRDERVFQTRMVPGSVSCRLARAGWRRPARPV